MSLVSGTQSDSRSHCPQCDACLQPDAILCIDCGYHLANSSALETKTDIAKITLSSDLRMNVIAFSLGLCSLVFMVVATDPNVTWWFVAGVTIRWVIPCMVINAILLTYRRIFRVVKHGNQFGLESAIGWLTVDVWTNRFDLALYEEVLIVQETENDKQLGTAKSRMILRWVSSMQWLVLLLSFVSLWEKRGVIYSVELRSNTESLVVLSGKNNLRDEINEIAKKIEELAGLPCRNERILL